MNSRDPFYLLLAGLTAPLWMRKERQGWRERRGYAESLPEPGPEGRVLIHAVSVGEVNALRSLIPELAASGGPEVVVSTTTDTGTARASHLFGGVCPVVRYPLDFSKCVGRFLDAIKPTAVALVELELWPNFVDECVRRGIPVSVINGRLSERSSKGYRRIRPLIGPAFRKLSFAAVQGEAYAERFADMGVRDQDVLITGSMKWDAAPRHGDGPSDAALVLAEALGIDRSVPLIVGGSTGPGEEALLHHACPTGVQLACAPRKPERFDQAADDLGSCVRRSLGERGTAERYLLDTIGELRALYELADLVVVGRSFGDLHGSDPIEPAALGKAIVIGPAFGDFLEPIRMLQQSDAVCVAARDELGVVLGDLMADPGRRRGMGERAAACVDRQRGASARHAELLRSIA
ncbi:MAG: glycosyltransferase N-terminal domain-containing protein [Planctomycetota bacterium]